MQHQTNMFVLETKPSEFKGRLRELRSQLKKDKQNEKLLEDFVEISTDMQSYLLKWNLQNHRDYKNSLSDEEIAGEIEKNYSLLQELGYENENDKIEKEVKKIKSLNLHKLSIQSDRGMLNNRWGNNDGTGLKYAMRRGVVLVTTNPKIVNVLSKRFPEYWGKKRDEIKQEYKGFTLEQTVARVTTEVVLESARLLRPVYKNGEKEMGYVSLQLNPNLSDNSEKMLNDANMIYPWLKEAFDGEDPNVVFKVPGTFAGLEVARELTSQGIGVNITVNYSVAQQLAFGEVIEGGCARHCYLTQMNRRLEAPIAEEIGEGECDTPKKISSWSSSAVIRRAYDILYNERAYKKSVLLSASINQPWHVQRSIVEGNNHPLHMTITPEDVAKFDSGLYDLRPCISEDIEESKIKRLLQSNTFRQAYEPDELKPKDFDTFKPTLKTLEGFRENYDEFAQWCNE